MKFLIYRATHRRDRLMVQLFNKDNKRYEWLKQELNLHDYKLKDVPEYRRLTRYERFMEQLRETNENKRSEKLAATRDEFAKQKEIFLKEKQRVLLEIQKELKELGFDKLKFPSIETSTQKST